MSGINTSADTANNLTDFNWDDSASDTFFGATQVASTPREVKPTTSKEDKIEPSTEDKDEDENVDTNLTDVDLEDEEDNFFDAVDKQSNTDLGLDTSKDGKDKSDNTAPSGSIYVDMYKDLKDIGVFKHIELPEGEELDADRFYELQQEEYEAEVATRLDSWANKDLDEDAKAFIKFKIQGGNTADFINSYRETSDFNLGDTKDEDYQDDVIRYQLSKEGWDNDEIEDRLEILTKNGKKEKISEKYHLRIEQEQLETREALVEQQVAQRESAKQQETKFKTSIKSTLDSAEEINGIKFNSTDKNEIFNYLTKRDTKGDKPVTEFQKGLSEVFNDPNKIVLLAKIIKSDFDFSSIGKAAVTKKTKEVKRNIEQRQSIRPSSSGSSLEGGLASLFND